MPRGLPWDHPDADPVGDIKHVLMKMREEYWKANRMRMHSFNDEGRCVHCDIRWARAVGTVCDNERVRTQPKETNEQRDAEG